MHFTSLFASALVGFSTLASAQLVHVISVGSTEEGKGLAFSPTSVDAAVGDMLQFQFRAGNHTLTQSTFDQPCMPMNMLTNSTGIYSGFMDVTASVAMGTIPVYTVEVSNTTPMWFYCSQGKHCQNGMVMVVNENVEANSTRSLDNYVQLAAAATVNLPGDATSVDEDNIGTAPAEGAGVTDDDIVAAAPALVPGMFAVASVAVALFLL